MEEPRKSDLGTKGICELEAEAVWLPGGIIILARVIRLLTGGAVEEDCGGADCCGSKPKRSSMLLSAWKLTGWSCCEVEDDGPATGMSPP